MSDSHYATICQQIGEPYYQVRYSECLKCRIKTCPINMIYVILTSKFPRIMDELRRELK